MIQRIQTIFLIDIVIVCILLLVFPFGNYEALFKTNTLSLSPLVDLVNVKPLIWGPIILNMTIAVFAVVVILGFKDRVKQLRNSRILMMMNAILGVSLLLLNFMNEQVSLNLEWPAYLPFISMFFALIAGIFIKKDEDLVKSVDRIR